MQKILLLSLTAILLARSTACHRVTTVSFVLNDPALKSMTETANAKHEIAARIMHTDKPLRCIEDIVRSIHKGRDGQVIMKILKQMRGEYGKLRREIQKELDIYYNEYRNTCQKLTNQMADMSETKAEISTGPIFPYTTGRSFARESEGYFEHLKKISGVLQARIDGYDYEAQKQTISPFDQLKLALLSPVTVDAQKPIFQLNNFCVGRHEIDPLKRNFDYLAGMLFLQLFARKAGKNPMTQEAIPYDEAAEERKQEAINKLHNIQDEFDRLFDILSQANEVFYKYNKLQSDLQAQLLKSLTKSEEKVIKRFVEGMLKKTERLKKFGDKMLKNVQDTQYEDETTREEFVEVASDMHNTIIHFTKSFSHLMENLNVADIDFYTKLNNILYNSPNFFQKQMTQLLEVKVESFVISARDDDNNVNQIKVEGSNCYVTNAHVLADFNAQRLNRLYIDVDPFFEEPYLNRMAYSFTRREIDFGKGKVEVPIHVMSPLPDYVVKGESKDRKYWAAQCIIYMVGDDQVILKLNVQSKKEDIKTLI